MKAHKSTDCRLVYQTKVKELRDDQIHPTGHTPPYTHLIKFIRRAYNDLTHTFLYLWVFWFGFSLGGVSLFYWFYICLLTKDLVISLFLNFPSVFKMLLIYL